jgi:hypothetical protein
MLINQSLELFKNLRHLVASAIPGDLIIAGGILGREFPLLGWNSKCTSRKDWCQNKRENKVNKIYMLRHDRH